MSFSYSLAITLFFFFFYFNGYFRIYQSTFKEYYTVSCVV